MNWLLPGHSQDDNEEEGEEEGNFVVACNLVSRSSAHLLRLQQALLSVSDQRQHVGGAAIGTPKMCVKSRTLSSDGLLVVPSASFLNKHYNALWKLLEQRSLLLFIHEYTRRAHFAAAYISKVDLLLENHLKKSHLSYNPTQHFCSSAKVHFVSLCQEFRIHLNHWSCLSAKVQADHYLRRALAQQNKMLEEIRQTLHLLGLQAIVLMERYVHAILITMGQSDLDQIPREVMADILTSLDLYNTAMEEQRLHNNTTHFKTKILQQICYTALTSNQRHLPAPVTIKDLLSSLAVHHAHTAASQFHLWTTQQCMCKSHMRQGISSNLPSRSPSTLSWEQLLDKFMSCSHFHTCQLNSPEHRLQNSTKKNHQHHPDLEKGPFFLIKDTNRDNLSFQCQKCTSNVSQVKTDPKHKSPLRNLQHLQKSSPLSTFYHLSTIPLSDFFQQDQSKVELLLHLLVSSNYLLAPMISHPMTPTAQQVPYAVTIDMLPTNGKSDPNQRIRDVTHKEIAEQDRTTERSVNLSSGGQRGLKELGEDVQKVVDDCAQRPRSVQWLDLGQSMLFDELLRQYGTLQWACFGKTLWLQMHIPDGARSTWSVNLCDNRRSLHVLEIISLALMADILPKQCKAMLEEFNLNMLVSAAHAHWDYVVCRGLGIALKDKCLTAGNQHNRSLEPSLNQDDSVKMSVTSEYLLQLAPPLLSALSYCNAPGSSSLSASRLAFHRLTVSLTLATMQLYTVWVMSKAYQFLSSWSLNKFLLITQGDLKVLRKSLDKMVQQTKSLVNSDSNFLSTLHSHNQLLLKQQLQKVDAASAELQAFSSLVLKTFSDDCKRISADLFEQTMPSAGHWRLNPRPGCPMSPNEYASLAAQNVIGQVLDGVELLPDDVRIQALSLTMTAFMEAWMEHILKERIKFSVQGALQLKQDFDSIRELICSDRYGLPEELLQRLLSLRVFHQVDSAVLCLLQQPQVRPYLQSRAWQSFTRCCPTKSSGDSLSAAVGSSITNLRGMEADYMTQSSPSVVSTDIPSVDPFIPGEPYLAPSLALGASQQAWLDLRIHTNSRRWRLPGLQCLSKSEP
ncbi:uncharacterized protein ccdc142 isoform X2 [Corythoichthys intestinalis]|nr:uncharacterized protein ccdc142 isoform X2 [Corythoichthys intestinalis]